MNYHTKLLSMTKLQKKLFISILISLALVLNYFERFIPIYTILGYPGGRIGLANIIVLLSMYYLTFSEMLLLVVLKVLLGSIYSGYAISSLLYSLVGSGLSFLIMFLLVKKLNALISIPIISIIGAIFHNIGQLIVASIIMSDYKILLVYIPHIIFISISTGLIIGLTVNYILKHLREVKL